MFNNNFLFKFKYNLSNNSEIISPSERKFYRHSSGMGTVMEYNDGTGVKKLLVLDRQYRNEKKFGTYGVDTPLTNYISDDRQTMGYLPSTATLTEEELKNYSTTDYINNGGITYNNAKAGNYIYFEDTNNAKQNCDIWMTYVGQQDNYTYSTPITGVPAVEWCRSQLVDGVPCDLPNIQQMVRIWLDREVIESLDPSTTTNYKLTTSSWWSSTENSSEFCRCIGSVGNVGAANKAITIYVCPVLELN